jgi:hypothetical protein
VLQVFYLVLSAVFASAIQKRGFPATDSQRQTRDHWLVWVVLFFAVFFGGYYVLAWVELATGLPLVTVRNATIGVLTAVVAYCLRTRTVPFGIPLTGRGNTGEQSVFRDWSQTSAIARLASLAVILGFGVIAGMLLAGFPDGYDPTAYHLPIGVHMLQSHSLGLWDKAFIHTLPANCSIFFGFLLDVLPEGAVAAASLLFLVPLSLAAYGLSRLTGADRTSCSLVTAGLLATPIVALNAIQDRSDVAGIAFLASAVFFALDTSIAFRQRCALCGLTAGIAFGFKSPHLVSVPFLLALLAWSHAEHLRSNRANAWPQGLGMLGGLLWFSLAFAAMAGFWLARNYVQLGNPLYPVYISGLFDFLRWAPPPDVDTASRTFSQHLWVGRSVEWLVYPWVESQAENAGFRHDSGFGPFFAVAIPPAILVAGIAVLMIREARRSALTWLLGGGVFALATWWVLGDRQPRFLMTALVYLPPLAAWTLTQSRRGLRRMYEAMLALTIAFMLIVVVSKQVAEFGRFAARGRQSQGMKRHVFYLYPEVIDRLPLESTIVNLAGRPWSYPLAGQGLHNRVVSFLEASRRFNVGTKASQNPIADWFQYPNRTPDYRLTYKELRELRATHVFTTGAARLDLGECVALKELGRTDRTPAGTNNQFPPRVLYEIHYCSP